MSSILCSDWAKRRQLSGRYRTQKLGGQPSCWRSFLSVITNLTGSINTQQSTLWARLGGMLQIRSLEVKRFTLTGSSILRLLPVFPPAMPARTRPPGSSVSLPHSVRMIACLAAMATWETPLWHKSYFESNVSDNQDTQRCWDLAPWCTPLAHPEEVASQSIPKWGRWLH